MDRPEVERVILPPDNVLWGCMQATLGWGGESSDRCPLPGGRGWRCEPPVPRPHLSVPMAACFHPVPSVPVKEAALLGSFGKPSVWVW